MLKRRLESCGEVRLAALLLLNPPLSPPPPHVTGTQDTYIVNIIWKFSWNWNKLKTGARGSRSPNHPHEGRTSQQSTSSPNDSETQSWLVLNDSHKKKSCSCPSWTELRPTVCSSVLVCVCSSVYQCYLECSCCLVFPPALVLGSPPRLDAPSCTPFQSGCHLTTTQPIRESHVMMSQVTVSVISGIHKRYVLSGKN